MFQPDMRSKPAFVERTFILLNEPTINGVVFEANEKFQADQAFRRGSNELLFV